MSVATAPATSSRRHLFSVDDYYRMDEAGVFAPGARVQLLDGEVVDMSPFGDRHAACAAHLTLLFIEKLGRSINVWTTGGGAIFGPRGIRREGR